MKQAQKLLFVTCENGDLQACIEYGEMLELGMGIVADVKGAQTLFEDLCNEGAFLACTRLGQSYQNEYQRLRLTNSDQELAIYQYQGRNPDVASLFLYEKACENEEQDKEEEKKRHVFVSLLILFALAFLFWCAVVCVHKLVSDFWLGANRV